MGDRTNPEKGIAATVLAPERCVEQRASFDCMTACLATIFACPYEDAPLLAEGEGTSIEGWWGILDAWLADRCFATIQRVRTEEDGDDAMRCPWSFPGLWIAGVKSPRIEGEHAVVMYRSELVWDPHPARAEGHRGFESADYFIPIDPGCLIRHRPIFGVVA